jgi:hypothetical protein
MTLTHSPIVRHNPAAPLILHPLSSDPVDRAIADRILDNGGCTCRVARFGRVIDAPVGYSLSIFKDREVVVPIDEFNSGHVAAYRSLNADLLARDEVYIGGWFNSKDGNVYLDCSIVCTCLGVAVTAARAADQLAIWDLSAKTEIRLN